MTADEVWDAELAVLAVILDTLRLNEPTFAGDAWRTRRSQGTVALSARRARSASF